jgi:transcriptional regulator with XRE-family HTH domain
MSNGLGKIGQHIRDLRVGNSLSQQTLAERAGMSYKYLGEIERGQVNLSVDMLIKIAKSLQVNPGDLLNDPVEETKTMVKVKSIFSELSKKDAAAALDILKAFHKNMK